MKRLLCLICLLVSCTTEIDRTAFPVISQLPLRSNSARLLVGGAIADAQTLGNDLFDMRVNDVIGGEFGTISASAILTARGLPVPALETGTLVTESPGNAVCDGPYGTDNTHAFQRAIEAGD